MNSHVNGTTRGQGTLIGVALIIFALCYRTVLMSLVSIWSTNYLYSYGFLVPIIAAFVWSQKGRGFSTILEPPDYTIGIGLTLAGVVMLVVGRVGSIVTLEHASLVVSLAGLVSLVFGRRTFKENWFPIAYLFLMVPIWDVLIDRLQDPSRFVSAKIATYLLDTVGVPVIQQGTNVILPLHTLAVMRECSGVNQLVVMMALVMPAAYLWLARPASRVAMVVLGVLITYFSNGFRIALVGWLAFKGLGDGNLLGSYAHVAEGLVTAMLGYIALAIGLAVLSRLDRGVSTDPIPPAGGAPATWSAALSHRRVWLDAIVVTVALAAWGSRVFAFSADVTLHRDLRELPMTISGWTLVPSGELPTRPFGGVAEELIEAYPTSAGQRRFAGVDDELIRTYRDVSGNQLQLYVGYYRRQVQGKELTNETARQLQLTASSLTLTSDVTISEIAHARSGMNRGILFWYDINGRVLPDEYTAKVHTVWEALAHRRTDGAVIMLGWQAAGDVSTDRVRKQAIAFAQSLMPILRGYLPA